MGERGNCPSSEVDEPLEFGASLEGVGSAVSVTGPCDVIAPVEAASIDDLGRMVVSRIQSVNGITRTLTCPVVHF